jgi:hypothetical protein
MHFLRNAMGVMAACGFLAVTMVAFRSVFVFVVLSHDRRVIRHVGVTAHPTAEWTARQFPEAFPGGDEPELLLRDNDKVCGDDFSRLVKAAAIRGVRTPLRSPWCTPCAERSNGTLSCSRYSFRSGRRERRIASGSPARLVVLQHREGRAALGTESSTGPGAAQHGLLDAVPNRKFACDTEPGRRFLIQFQSCVPHAAAHDTYLELLARSRAARMVPSLLVLERHRPDPFRMTHAVDGWSLAMDFKVTQENRARLRERCRARAEPVLAAGGRFDFARDLVLGPDAVARFLPSRDLQCFLALERRLDPVGLLQTNHSRRLLGTLAGAEG